MKRFTILILAACVFLRIGSAWAAEAVQTLSSRLAPRVNVVNGYIDMWQVTTGPCRLVSLFGYNSGAQQWVQLYDCATTNGTVAFTPVITITGFSSSLAQMTNQATVSGALSPGEPIQFTNTYAGLAAGIYYVTPVGTNIFQVAASRSDALGGGNQLSLSGGTTAGKANRVPIHTFTAAASDNFSCIVPNTAMDFAHGLLVATSSTGGTYTPAASSNITAIITIIPKQ